MYTLKDPVGDNVFGWNLQVCSRRLTPNEQEKARCLQNQPNRPKEIVPRARLSDGTADRKEWVCIDMRHIRTYTQDRPQDQGAKAPESTNPENNPRPRC